MDRTKRYKTEDREVQGGERASQMEIFGGFSVLAISGGALWIGMSESVRAEDYIGYEVCGFFAPLLVFICLVLLFGGSLGAIWGVGLFTVGVSIWIQFIANQYMKVFREPDGGTPVGIGPAISTSIISLYILVVLLFSFGYMKKRAFSKEGELERASNKGRGWIQKAMGPDVDV